MPESPLTDKNRFTAIICKIQEQDGMTWLTRVQQAVERYPQLFFENGKVWEYLYAASDQLAPTDEDEEELLAYLRLLDDSEESRGTL